jgi:hypothetical protein
VIDNKAVRSEGLLHRKPTGMAQGSTPASGDWSDKISVSQDGASAVWDVPLTELNRAGHVGNGGKHPL